MQNYKEINGNDYVKDSRTTINETMRSIQSMNSGTVFPTTNLFEGMKCYRTDLKKTYTLTDVKNNTWVEDAHAALSDEATHAASATKLQTPRSLNLSGAVTADAANFDGTANATINVKTLDASKLKGTAPVSTTGNAATATKLATARTIALSGNATGSTTFDGSGNATINVTVSESAHAATATQVVATAPVGGGLDVIHAIMGDSDAARVRVYGDANNGALEIATGDDGTEPIYARQYVNSSIDKFTTVARTAAILDANGNTSFPGTVVAPKFTGELNGNAATASKLITPRTISLTGKAAGSATFDGSANAAINVTSVNADTASKLSTARKINITGNATGAANFDGTGDVSINTTVNESKHAGAADTLKSSAATETSTVARPVWLSWEGDNTKQTVSPNLTYTCATKTLAAANFKGHLAGNADTATNAAAADKVNNSGNKTAVKDGTREPNGLYLYQCYNNGYPTAYGNVLSIGGSGGGELLAGWSGSDKGIEHLYYRSRRDAVNLWSDWRTVAFTSDINSYAPTKTGAGASGSWNINAATATKLQTPRTISLTGNASGSATFDGSRNISINTNVNYSTTSARVIGYYTGNGGQQGPGYFGKERAGCLMSNAIVRGHSEYKNWLYMDNYSGTDVGGATAIGVSRQEMRAYIMRSNADRATWNDSAELLSSANYNEFAPTKTGAGASGTWPISISGNADTVDGYHASDLINRITAANTGGIVAASLTENGYVKFANGLILQWGSYRENGSFASHSFPIAFPTSCFKVLLSTQTPSEKFLSEADSTTTLLKFDNASFTSGLAGGGKNGGWIGNYFAVGM